MTTIIESQMATGYVALHEKQRAAHRSRSLRTKQNPRFKPSTSSTKLHAASAEDPEDCFSIGNVSSGLSSPAKGAEKSIKDGGKERAGVERGNVKRHMSTGDDDAGQGGVVPSSTLLKLSDLQTSCFMTQLKTAFSLLSERHVSEPKKVRGVPLSKAFKQFPRQFSSMKISVVEKNINEIDVLPEAYHGIEVLYLSQNRLTSLKGIEQFPNLATLSLSHNPLTSFDSLNPLRETHKALRNASFVGCPMTKLPNYRAHVVHRIPWLNILDGKTIDEEQRSLSELTIEKERSVMAILIHNYCLMLKLDRVHSLLILHQELRKILFGGHPCFQSNLAHKPLYTELDIVLFLRVWSFEKSLEATDIQELYHQFQQQAYSALCQLALNRDRRVKDKTSDEWDAAFTQVITRQQKQLCHVLSVTHKTKKGVTESARNLGLCAQSRVIEELKKQDESGIHQQASLKESIIKDLSGNVDRLKRLLNKESVGTKIHSSTGSHQQQKKEKWVSVKETQTTEVAKEGSGDSDTKTESPSQHETRMDESALLSKQAASQESTTDRTLPSSEQTAGSEPGRKGRPTRENKLKGKIDGPDHNYREILQAHGPRSSHSVVSVRQTALENLRSRMDYKTTKRTASQQSAPAQTTDPSEIRERVESTNTRPTTDDKNYQQALINSNTRLHQAEQAVSSLQEECSRLRANLKDAEIENGRIKHMLSSYDNKEHEMFHRETTLRQNLENCEQVALRYECQLREHIADCQRKQTIESLGERSLKRRVFKAFLNSCRDSITLSIKGYTVEAMVNNLRIRRSFAWWAKTAKRTSDLRFLFYKCNAQSLQLYFDRWQHYLESAKELKSSEFNADLVRQLAVNRMVFRHWYRYVADNRLDTDTDPELSEEADKYSLQSLSKKAFTSWYIWISVHARPKQQRRKKSKRRRGQYLLKKSLKAWQSHHSHRVDIKRQLNLLQRLSVRNKMYFALQDWKAYVQRQQEKKKLAAIGDTVLISNTLQKWSDAYLQRKEIKDRYEKSHHFHASFVLKTTLSCWREVLKYSQFCRHCIFLSKQSSEVRLKDAALKSWLVTMEDARMESDRKNTIVLLLTKHRLALWTKLTHGLLLDDAKTAFVLHLKQSRQSRNLPKAFYGWQGVVKERKQARHLDFQLDQKSQRRCEETNTCRLITEVRYQRLIRMQSLTIKLQTELDELDKKQTISASEIERLYERLQQSTLQEQGLKNRIHELETNEGCLKRNVQREVDEKRDTAAKLNAKNAELEKTGNLVEALRERNAELLTTIREQAARLEDSEQASRQRQEEVKKLLTSLDSRSRHLQAFATQTHETARGLHSQVALETDCTELPQDSACAALSKLEKQKSRWASSAKRLGKQLELRTREVQNLERQLATVISTCKD